jgi:hypothetical protein
LQSCMGEDELDFWKALCASAPALHHGWSSVQVGRCWLLSSSTLSTSTRRQKHCHQHRQQRYCYTSTTISTRAVRATYLDLFNDRCCTVCLLLFVLINSSSTFEFHMLVIFSSYLIFLIFWN